MDKEEYDKFIQGRIKSLKDVVEVHFEVEQDDQTKSEKWICPVTSKELGPNVKAVYLVPCGHAFSQEAIKEMKSEGKCVQCATAYEERDVVPILPSTEQDKAFVIQRIETLKSLGLTHSLKKAGGSKKRKANGDGRTEQAHDAATENKEKRSNGQAQPLPADIPRSGTPHSGTSTPKASNGIKNSATASLTARILEEEEARKKRRRENENISSLYTKKSDGKGRRDGEFMTRGFSMSADARHR